MASYRKRGKTWYFRYVDADGVKREDKGCSDRRATEELARQAESVAARIKAGLVAPNELAQREHEARPLEEHFADWRAVLLARGRTVKHAELYLTRAARVADLAKARKLNDLHPSRIQAALATLRDEGKSLQTCEHHRASIRAFSRWARADGRLRDDPMLGVTGFNVQEDIRHERRVLTDPELARLIEAAETGPVAFKMTGTLRAMAYRTAAGTGFRVDELRSLTPERFRLEGERPSIVLKAPDAKNRRGVEQPLPRALAGRLRVFLASMPPGASVFPLHHETAKAIRIDLERAGIPYETEEGKADFHSLRGFYISALVRSGASIKTVQTLARHSNPALTLARYAKASLLDISGAVEDLPDLTPS